MIVRKTAAELEKMRRSGLLAPVLNPVRFSKEARFLAQSARFEAGQVYLPRVASWLPAYESELLAFPTGRHDDQVDSTSQALHWLTARTPVRRERPSGRPRPAGRPRPFRRSLGPSRNDVPLI